MIPSNRRSGRSPAVHLAPIVGHRPPRGTPRLRVSGLCALPAVLALLGSGLASCGAPPAPRNPHVPVTVAEVIHADVPYTITANGLVEPLQTVAVEAQVGGVLTDVAFQEGDEVRAGQVLFRIDPRPYEAALRQARANLAKDQAQAANAQRDAERYARLVTKDYVTQSQADQAKANADAQQALVQADQAAVENAQLNLGYTTIVAPIAGRAGSLLVHRGNVVRPAAGSPLVVINQIHPILVRFSVPERDLPAVQEYGQGKALPVAATPAEGVGQEARGTLTFIDNAVDQSTGTVLLKARFDNQDRALWPGEFVTVRLQLYMQQNALTIPAEAVVSGQEGTYVFVVDSAGRARIQHVAVGRTADDRLVVDSGLVVGERVVTDGQSRLSPGAIVDVRSPGGITAARPDSAISAGSAPPSAAADRRSRP